MSIPAMNWAWRQQLSDPTTKLLLIFLADRASENPDYAEFIGDRHVTWISVVRMAQYVGVSERAIQRHLKVLEDAKLIERVSRFRPNGSQATNFTVLACNDDGPVTGGVSWDAPPGGSPVAGGGGSPVAPLEPSVTNPQEEPSEATSSLPRVAEVVVGEIVDEAKISPATAQTILAKLIDGCVSCGVVLTPRIKGMYAKKIKELLDGGISSELIFDALRLSWRKRTIDRVQLLDNYLIEVQAGPAVPRPRDVRTNQEVRNDQIRDLIDQAKALVTARGESTNNNNAMRKAMREIRDGVVSIGALLAPERKALPA